MKNNTREILEITLIDNPVLASCKHELEQVFNVIKSCYQQGNKLLICGNGGSAADCEHIVGELMKGFVLQRAINQATRNKIKQYFPQQADYLADHLQMALPAISLVSHISLNTAFINDIAADMTYAQQVFGYGKEGDVLLALSTSGNAPNVVNAARISKVGGLKTVAITGQQGGDLATLADVTIKLPADKTYKIQEYTLVVYHCLCAMLENEFFAEEVLV